MDTKVDSSRAIHVPVAGRLSKPIAFVKSRAKILAVVAVLLIGGALAYVWWTRKDTAADYVTDKVSRGSIEVAVSATGTVQAVTTVQVGSQVSGAVAWLGADFKSKVTKGQVIAKLDPALFQSQVNIASANLLNAQAAVQGALTDIQNQTANVDAAKANDRANQAQRDDAIAIAKQNEQLRGVITDREIEAAQNAAKVAIARYSQATSQIGQAQAQLEIAKSKLKQAQAAVAQAKAQLDQANVNLQHSIIESPIDGVVVSRNVDVGQTVAASLQAPTLFTIANDLTNMQVLASIDEADVGQVREGGKAHFSVDAFPGQTFNGDITQLRLNAQTLQNVVTYTAVISVANPDQKLMPGMTANITVPVARRDDVLRVPNSSLRFKPELTDQQQKDLQAKIDAFRQQQQGQSGNEGEQQNQPQADKQPQGEKQKADQSPTASPAGSGAEKQRHRPTGQGGSKGQSGDKNSNGGGQAKQAQGDNQGSSSGSQSGGGKQRHQQQASGDNSQAAASGSPGGGGKRRHQAPGDNSQAAASASPSGGGKQTQQQQAQGGNKGAPQQGQKSQQAQGQQPGANQTTPAGGQGGGGRQRQIQVVWVLTANKTLEPRVIRTGITDGRLTEIVAGDLKEGDVIVIGQTGGTTSNSNSNRTPQSTSPLSPRPPGAGAGRGR
jgi:HlyD family secretion protein